MRGAPASHDWVLRRAGGVPYAAFPEFEQIPWLVHGVSAVHDGDAERTGEPLGPALGLAGFERARLAQVHGCEVVGIARGGAPHAEGSPPSGDALATDAPGVALEIRVADCVPIFAVDRERRAIGLAHAGWRGTLAGVAGRLAAFLAEPFGSRPADLVVWLGPSISPDCFKVGPEVIGPFRKRYGESAVAAPNRVDLWESIRTDLARAGVPASSVRASGLCTHCRTDLFHSHRGSGGRPGRNLALIAIRT